MEREQRCQAEYTGDSMSDVGFSEDVFEAFKVRGFAEAAQRCSRFVDMHPCSVADAVDDPHAFHSHGGSSPMQMMQLVGVRSSSSSNSCVTRPE